MSPPPDSPFFVEDEDSPVELKSPQCTNSPGFFANSRNFDIHGGHFAIHNHIYTGKAVSKDPPTDFRKIRWCDIFLKHTLDVVQAKENVGGRCSVQRTIYSAEIEGRSNSNKTVVIYDGDNAKEDWHKDITKYLRLRHPNVFQLFGISYSSEVYAAIFHHQELVPARLVLEKYRGSNPITTIYFHDFLKQEFEHHGADLARMLRVPSLKTDDCTLWLNTAEQLCIELSASDFYVVYAWSNDQKRGAPSKHLIQPNHLPDIVDTLTLDGCHNSCTSVSQSFTFPVEKDASARLGSIMCQCSTTKTIREVAFLNGVECSDSRLYGTEMNSGWVRPMIPEYINDDGYRNLYYGTSYMQTDRALASQANYIFSRDKNYSPWDVYFATTSIFFFFSLQPTSQPNELRDKAFLFLPPLMDFLSPDGTRFQYPTRTPYWSLNLSGDPPLAPAHEIALGLPSVKLEIVMEGRYYSPQVYEAIREFHQHKGFNPESQDVARKLGDELYHLVNDEMDPDTQLSRLTNYLSDSAESVNDDSEMDSEEEEIVYPRSKCVRNNVPTT